MIRSIAAALLAIAASTSPISAQGLSKVFVASYGNDTNDGGRATPRRSFQKAHDVVASGGEIVVLDTAGYGQVTITKSLGIVVPPGVNGFVTVSGASNAVVVDAGSTGTVSLQGLIIEGGGSSGGGNGIDIRSAKNVTIEDTQIRSFSNGIGTTALTGTFSSTTRLEVRRTSVQQANTGILVVAATDSMLRANFLDTNVQDSLTGFSIGRGVYALLSRSEVTGGVIGLRALQYGSAVIDGCKFSHNSYAFDVSLSGNTVYTLSNNVIAYNDHYVNGASDLSPISLH